MHLSVWCACCVVVCVRFLASSLTAAKGHLLSPARGPSRHRGRALGCAPAAPLSSPRSHPPLQHLIVVLRVPALGAGDRELKLSRQPAEGWGGRSRGVGDQVLGDCWPHAGRKPNVRGGGHTLQSGPLNGSLGGRPQGLPGNPRRGLRGGAFSGFLSPFCLAVPLAISLSGAFG